ncbi:MAG: hypothetical protein K0S08_1849 [Gammaproteobacteria bacterium]|jgi:hypothetical protein|nr:hypothetical protein [Gammaproteobacteria bacterium]
MPYQKQGLEKKPDLFQLPLKEQSAASTVDYLKWYQRFFKRLSQLNDILGSAQTLAQILKESLKIIAAIGDIFNYVWNGGDLTFSLAQFVQDVHRFKTRSTSRVKNGLGLGLSALIVIVSVAVVTFTFYAVSVGAIALGPLCSAIAVSIAAVRSGYLFVRSCLKSSREGLLKDREGSIRVLREKLSISSPQEVKQRLDALNGKEDEFSVQQRRELLRLYRLQLQQEALSEENPKDEWKRKLQKDLLLEQRPKRDWNLFKFATSVMFAVSFSLLCVPFPPLTFAGAVIAVVASATVAVGNVARYCINSYDAWRTEDTRERLMSKNRTQGYDDESLSKRYLKSLTLTKEEKKKYWYGLSPSMQQAKIQEQLLKEEESEGLKQNRGKQILNWFKHELASPPPKFVLVTGLFSAASNVARGIGWLLKKAAMLVCVSLPVLAVASVAAVKDAVFAPKPLVLVTENAESQLSVCTSPGANSSNSLSSFASRGSQPVGQEREAEAEEEAGSAPPVSGEVVVRLLKVSEQKAEPEVQQEVRQEDVLQEVKQEAKQQAWLPFGRPSSRPHTALTLFFGRPKTDAATQPTSATLQETGDSNDDPKRVAVRCS